MPEQRWQEHILRLPDHNLAWYELGRGPTIIALSGGPGDDHWYLRPVVEPMASKFRWVLYDQRGTGASVLNRQNAEALHVIRLVEDLEALRVHLGEDTLSLVGHSWGANLALLYSAVCPHRVNRAALIGLGPLDDEMQAVAAANLMKPLSRAEREEHSRLGREMDRAIEGNDPGRTAELHARRIELFVRGAVLSPEKAREFIEEYRATDAHSRFSPRVNRLVFGSYRKLDIWDGIDGVKASLLVLYGYQDFEPITQAYRIRERLPRTRIRFLSRCGHIPWLEQPDAFYRELGEFLEATSEAVADAAPLPPS